MAEYGAIRLDNSSTEPCERFGIEFNEKDPGDTQSIDLCRHCASLHSDLSGYECERPWQVDSDEQCTDCGGLLIDGGE